MYFSLVQLHGTVDSIVVEQSIVSLLLSLAVKQFASLLRCLFDRFVFRSFLISFHQLKRCVPPGGHKEDGSRRPLIVCPDAKKGVVWCCGQSTFDFVFCVIFGPSFCLWLMSTFVSFPSCCRFPFVVLFFARTNMIQWSAAFLAQAMGDHPEYQYHSVSIGLYN